MTKLELFILRRQKGIKLREVANHLKCSIALVSQYENNKRFMSNDRVKNYEEFIKNYNQNQKGRCEDEH